MASFVMWPGPRTSITLHLPAPWQNDRLPTGRALCAVDGPFDRIAHTVIVRRPNSTLMPGRFDRSFGRSVRPGAGGPYSVPPLPGRRREDMGRHCYTSVSWATLQLFNHPFEGARGATRVPVPISRRMFEDRLPVDVNRTPPIA